MRLIATLKPTRMSTRLLITRGGDDVLKAVLPPPHQADPRAAEKLLEALALWFQSPLYVVLYADSAGTSSELALCDGFGFGKKTVYFEVEVFDRRFRRSLGPFGSRVFTTRSTVTRFSNFESGTKRRQERPEQSLL